MEHGLVIDIAVCIIAAWVFAVLCQFLKQPLLLAYLLAGFVIGPHGLKFVTDHHSIETISSIGLILLLFMIGLEIDLKKMVSAGRVITVSALAQILGCVGLGWGFFRLVGLGGTWLEALYLGVAAAMSSTVIIVKVLYEKRELETLAGRITVGVMVLQDLATILFLAIQPNLNNPAASVMALAIGKVFVLILVGYLVSRFVLPPIFAFVARLPELVLIGALAWCFAMAGLANYLGLSREMGALIAGVMVSTFPYTLDVAAKVTSLRDFFVTLFFVGLGMGIPMPTPAYMVGMLIFSGFLVVSRFATIFTPLYKMGQGLRISLLPAINLSQLSELSLVLLTLGKASGDVSDKALGIAAFSFAFLAVASTYGMVKSEAICSKALPLLNRFGLRDLNDPPSDQAEEKKSKRIFLLGFFWSASSLLEDIKRDRPALLEEIRVVDFNPQAFHELHLRGVDAVYGDVAQRDVLLHAGVAHAEIILCTLPDSILKGANNLKILRQLRELNPTAQIIVHAERLSEVANLYEAGAGYVSLPRLLEASDLIKAIAAAEKNLLTQKRAEQDERLKGRAEVMN